jgi:hypothetical protein
MRLFQNLIWVHFLLRKKPGFPGLSNCRFAAITSGVLPEAKLRIGIHGETPAKPEFLAAKAARNAP